MISTQIKQPAETLKVAPAFDTRDPLIEVVSIVVAARGLVVGAPPITALGTVAGGIATISMVGGVDGERYLITVRATDAGGKLLESELEVAVVDATWQLPDGGAPYLSIGKFVDHFGLDEVVAMTDANGSGRIDRALLISALTGAQAIADSNIASRYSVPLETVPPIVELAIADIARARLYPRGAPDGVADAAKAAVRTLERIASGALPLGVAQPPAPVASDTPILTFGGNRAYPDNLVDF